MNLNKFRCSCCNEMKEKYSGEVFKNWARHDNRKVLICKQCKIKMKKEKIRYVKENNERKQMKKKTKKPSMTKKYYFYKMEVISGEHEFLIPNVIQLDLKDDIDKELKDVARDYYGNEEDDSHWCEDMEWYDFGEVGVRVDSHQKITAKEFHVLAKYI